MSPGRIWNTKERFWIPLNKLRSFNNAGPNSPSRILSNPERMKKIHYYNNIPYSYFNLVAWKKWWCFLSILKDLQIITERMLRRVSMTNLKGAFAFLSVINTQYKFTTYSRTIQNNSRNNQWRHVNSWGLLPFYKISNTSLHKLSNFILRGTFPKKSQTASKFLVFWVNLNSIFVNMNWELIDSSI